MRGSQTDSWRKSRPHLRRRWTSVRTDASRAVTRLVIVGAGGFGREVLDIVEAINATNPMFDFLGFVDDDDSLDLGLLRRRGARIPRSHRCPSGYRHKLRDWNWFAVHSTTDRREDQRLGTHGRVDRAPALDGRVPGDVEPGAIVAAGARLTTNIRIGRHFHANLNATVGHDCDIGDYAP